MRNAAFEMAKSAHDKGIKVIIASSDSTDHYEDYLQHSADFIVMGEGEISLLALVNSIKHKTTFDDIHGIAFKKGNETIVNPKRAILTELDTLPLPAWDLLDIHPYKNAWKNHGYFSINLATTRGCPYKCNWCSKPIYGNRYNSRSPQHVVKEIKYLQTLFAFDHIWFSDDIFGLKPAWVQEFNEVLKAENIKIKYKIQSRADLLLKDDTIISLAESGCDEVWIGAESGAQKILDAMDKGTSVEQIKESTLIMKKHGLKPCYFLQFGYLSENWTDIKATLNLLFEMMPYDIGVSVSYPLPGTKFYDIVKSEMSDKSNWEDSDELLMMYEGTYAPAFYKKLHRFIHKRFRQKQIEADFRKGKFNRFARWFYFKFFSNLEYLQLKLMKGNTKN